MIRWVAAAALILGAAVQGEGQDEKPRKKRGYLGVTTGELSAADREALGLGAADGGLRVTDVVDNSAAERAGLRPGDVILRLDGEKIETMQALSSAIQAKGAGTEVSLEILRDKDRIQVKATLAIHPSERVFEDAWPPPVPPTAEPVGRLAALCATDIPWIAATRVSPAEALAEARRRAAESGRPILWYVFRIPGPHIQRYALLDRYATTGPFADPEVAELLRRKFIPLRLAAVEGVGDPYGLRALDAMEPALVFLRPDGTLVHKMDRLRSLTPEFILESMRLVLAKAPECNRSSAKGSGLDLALERILEGDYDGADAAIGRDESGRAMLLRGILHRRRFQAEEALRCLAIAKERLGGSEPAAEALVLFKSGRLREARAAYEALLAAHPGSPREAEALYRLGECDYLEADEPRAAERWRRLVERHPDSIWARKAAAHLTQRRDCFFGESALTHAFEDPLWPAPGALAELRGGSEHPQRESDLPHIAARGVRFLLRHQRSNGSWPDSRYIFGQGPAILPNVWVAVTAMACAALLEWRHVDPAGVDAALRRAMPYLLDEKNVARGRYETSYADAFRAIYFARRLRAFPAEKERLLPVLEDLVRKLESQQVQGGFWWHEYPNPFITGMVLWALAQAKEAGAATTAEVVARGVSALRGLRAENGSWPYYTRGRSHVKDSSGRMPLNELALLSWGQGSQDAVAAALDNFFEHYDRLDRVRKSDYHADGELAGFFYFHSFLPAAEAAAALGGRGEPAMRRLRGLLAQIPEIDGSFAEDHEIGKSYATAMALLSLRRLRNLAQEY